MSQKQNLKPAKKFVKNARNVLALPKNVFWPLIQEPDYSLLVDLMQNGLKHARTIQPELRWSEMQKLSKEERKKLIKNVYSNLSPDSLAQHQKALNLKKDLSIGVNEVCRGLERSDLACCLVSGGINPKLLVSHIVDLSRTKRVPVLIIDSLKEKIKDSLGFSALAVGFKNNIQDKEGHEMHELCNEVINLFNKNYSYDSLSLINEEVGEKIDVSMENSSSCTKFNENDIIIHTSEVNLNEIYLYRDSTNYRVFKPNEIRDPSLDKNGDDSKFDSNFQMDLGEDEDECKNKFVEKRIRYYEPPIIHRVQSNPNKKRKSKKKKQKNV